MTLPTIAPAAGVQRVGRGRYVAPIAALLVGLAIVAYVVYVRLHPAPRVAARVAALVKASAGQRTIEARLTGGFSWVPFRVRRGGSAEPALASNPLLLGAAADIMHAAESDRSPETLQALAAAQLLMGNAKLALATLGAAGGTRSAAAWSDLAVARYAAAEEERAPQQLIEALVAADTALSLSLVLAEARFNRALILERLGFRELALAAWNRYLEVDGGSRWSVEARDHARRLGIAPPLFSNELECRYDDIAADGVAAEELARRFPQETRMWGETEILGRWADSELKGDPAAARHFAVARSFARLTRTRGDAMLERAVERIAAAGEQRRELAAAHLAFRQAQNRFSELKPTEAEPLYVKAADAFSRGGSPMALLARHGAASCAYEQGRVAEATGMLEALRASVSDDFPALRSLLDWELGLCRNAAGQWGEAMALFTGGMHRFEALGETGNSMSLRELLAQVLDLSGDPVSAWAHHVTALHYFGQTNSKRLHSSLGSIAQTAILRRDWAAAASLLSLELEAAQAAKSPFVAADALVRRALVLQRLDDAARGRSDLSEAQSWIQRVPDRAMRSQLEGRVLWADAVLASSPARGIAAVDRAIAYHASEGRRAVLPSLWLDRARVHRSLGDAAAAADDLDHAMSELELHRESLPRGERRWGVFYASEDIFEEAIDLALNRGDVEGAFGYADRARARTLLDRLRPQTPLAPPSVAAGVTILEYATSLKGLVIFAAGRGELHVIRRKVDREALAKEIERLQQVIAGGDPAVLSPAARAMYQLLIEPAAAWIAPNDTVVIVPDATLSSVPFAALVGGGGRYLAEEHPLIVSPSAATFAGSPERRSGTPRDLLLVVNGSAPGQERLGEAEAEARAVGRQYAHVKRLEGSRATAAAFTRGAARAGMIHFTGHGLVSELRAEETSLVLAGDNGSEDRFDVRRIAAMKLERSPVVVLAACSTARGRVTPLEGTMSVARAFLAAGAGSVVATLWPVEDRAAAAFFARLHQHLARGESPADALRATQTECIRDSIPPSMWAAVQVIGS